MCECPLMYSEVIRRARKPHKCCECGTAIAEGEQYQVASGKWDGRFDTFCTCLACVAIRSKAIEGLDSHDCCDLPCFTQLFDYISCGLPDTAALVADMKSRFTSTVEADRD